MGCEGGFAYVMLEPSVSWPWQIERAGADNGQFGVPRRQIRLTVRDEVGKAALTRLTVRKNFAPSELFGESTVDRTHHKKGERPAPPPVVLCRLRFQNFFATVSA